MWSVKVEKRAGKALRRMDQPAQKQVAKVIERVKSDPFSAGQKMQGEWRGYYRAWAGDKYRVIWRIEEATRTVRVTHIFPRGDAPY